MKRVFAAMLAVALCVCLCACGNKADSKEYIIKVTDEQGRQGAKFRAEGSSGYDFRYADEDFTLFPGDTYTGIWSYESGDGPSDWEEVSYCYTVQLVEADE